MYARLVSSSSSVELYNRLHRLTYLNKGMHWLHDAKYYQRKGWMWRQIFFKVNNIGCHDATAENAKICTTNNAKNSPSRTIQLLFKIFWMFISPPNLSFHRNSLSDNVYLPRLWQFSRKINFELFFALSQSARFRVVAHRRVPVRFEMIRESLTKFCCCLSIICW